MTKEQFEKLKVGDKIKWVRGAGEGEITTIDEIEGDKYWGVFEGNSLVCTGNRGYLMGNIVLHDCDLVTNTFDLSKPYDENNLFDMISKAYAETWKNILNEEMEFGYQNKPNIKTKLKTMSSVIKNLAKSKERKALEHFELCNSDGSLNECGRTEFTDFIYENGSIDKKEFLAKLVEAHKEATKK